MSLPDAVKKAEAEADAAVEQMEVALAEETEGAISDMDELDQTPDSEEDEAVDSTPADPEPVSQDDGTKYQQRYETLLGKYNAEVPRLHSTLSEMQGRLSVMEDMQQQVQSPADAANDPPGDPGLRYLTDAEREDYGADVLDVNRRLSRGEAEVVVDSRVVDMESRLAVLEGRAISADNERSGNDFWSRVDRHYPGAREIDRSDPLWHEFLQGTDPVSGLSYKAIGEAAWSSGDISRVVDLLEQYKPPTSEKGKTKAKRSVPSVKPKGKGSTVETPSDKSGLLIKSSAMEKFYADLARGKYAGREEEARQREDEIETAVMENRIVPG